MGNSGPAADTVLSAILKGLDHASHQHGPTRADTLATLCALLLGEGEGQANGAALPLFTCLKGSAAAEIIARSYTFNRLCSSDTFSLIFALSAYNSAPSDLRLNPNSKSVLRQGMTRLFWRDVDRCERTFKPVYDGLVALAESPGDPDPRPNVELACAFYLHYCTPSGFTAFLKRMGRPASTSNAAPEVETPPPTGPPATAADSFSRGNPQATAAAAPTAEAAEAAGPAASPRLLPAISDPSAALQAEDSSGAVAVPPLSPRSRRDVRIRPALPIFIREVCGMLDGMRNAASLVRYLEMLGALGLTRRIADDDDEDADESDDDQAYGSGGAGTADSRRGGTKGKAQRILLDGHSAARLLTTLDQLTTPGGPLYPTPLIRRQAAAATKAIFPDGHSQRRLVQCGFRALHPVAISKAASASWWAQVMWLLGCKRKAAPSASSSSMSSTASGESQPSPQKVASDQPRRPAVAVPGLKNMPVPGALVAAASTGDVSAASTTAEPERVTSSPPRQQLLGHTGRSSSRNTSVAASASSER